MKKMILECANQIFPSWKEQFNDLKHKALTYDNFILRCTVALCEEEQEEKWANCDLTALID